MKRTKRVSKGRKRSAKIARIQAVAAGLVKGRKRRPKYLPSELEGMYKPVKKPVTLRLDADILSWFQRDGRGYQTRINEALRKVMVEERR
ncbi:MAG TPA: BrnA antitoxin family protein [Terriglobales bacterium]|nr:BrnA antitoxin family protein [Terriglobales bacterium]